MKRTISATLVVGTTLAILTTAPDPTLAGRLVPISQHYTKAQLDKTCAANGGTSYGDETTYGCTKGQNSVECTNGKCTGYVGNGITANPGAQTSATQVLQQQTAVIQHGTTTGAAGASATISQ
jgi:hypothetical protein